VATGLASQVGFSLRFAQAAVWSDLVATLEPFDLRPHHYAALLIVAQSAGCKQQEIGEALGLYRSNLVAVIDELSGRGLIRRVVNPDDRRSYALSLTDVGVALMPSINAAHARHCDRLAQALGPHDSALLVEMLDRLAAIGTAAAQGDA
jgi:DNA-binding MarR family transcriptional regulator